VIHVFILLDARKAEDTPGTGETQVESRLRDSERARLRDIRSCSFWFEGVSRGGSSWGFLWVDPILLDYLEASGMCLSKSSCKTSWSPTFNSPLLTAVW